MFFECFIKYVLNENNKKVNLFCWKVEEWGLIIEYYNVNVKWFIKRINDDI